MRFVLTCFAVLFFALPCVHAQAARGVVTDAETGEPIPGANVLLAGSQIGDATDFDGQFVLATVLEGSRMLVISAVGFETVTRTVVLPGAVVNVSLAPVALEIGEAVVEGEQPRLWRQRLRKFEGEFIGRSRNARNVEILNPLMLDFEESEEGVFTATAREPLVVGNDALGYTLTFFGLAYTSTDERWSWQGEVTFEEMEGSERQRRRWTQARQRAYLGSWPHFAARMAAGDAYAAGYRVLPISYPGKRVSINTLTLSDQDLQRAITADDPAQPHILRFRVPSYWLVRYIHEEGGNPNERWMRGGGQVSYLEFDGRSIRLTRDGQVLDPLRVVRYGHWDWERVADLLPTDYVPVDA